MLYVANAHRTYASTTGNRNGYLTALDPKTGRVLWQSPSLVANADGFAVVGDVIVTGYGFTAEPDYLYALDRSTGRVLDRLPLPTGPERITAKDTTPERPDVRPPGRRQATPRPVAFERRPARVDVLLGVRVRLEVEVLPAGRAQAGAICPAENRVG